MQNPRERVGEHEWDGESVEEEPGEEVRASPKAEAAEGEEVNEGGEGSEHGDGQTWKWFKLEFLLFFLRNCKMGLHDVYIIIVIET